MKPSVKARPPECEPLQHLEPRIAGLFALWLGLASGLFAAAPAQAWQCEGQALRIHDGDTLSVRCDGRGLLKIRMADIDAPELHQAYGMQARHALLELSAARRIEVRSVAVDLYQRVVARLKVGDDDLGMMLIDRGLAWCGRRPGKACTARQAVAKQARLGLWSDPDAQPPWQWRRQHPRQD